MSGPSIGNRSQPEEHLVSGVAVRAVLEQNRHFLFSRVGREACKSIRGTGINPKSMHTSDVETEGVDGESPAPGRFVHRRDSDEDLAPSRDSAMSIRICPVVMDKVGSPVGTVGLGTQGRMEGEGIASAPLEARLTPKVFCRTSCDRTTRFPPGCNRRGSRIGSRERNARRGRGSYSREQGPHSPGPNGTPSHSEESALSS